jgi:hypothetical protein
MHIKYGVNIEELDPIVLAALPTIEACRIEALEKCLRDQMTVTSAAEGYPGDGVHSFRSWHYLQNCPRRKGLAVDIRDDFEGIFAGLLRRRLGPGWDIIEEGDHVHCERDPRKAPLNGAQSA